MVSHRWHAIGAWVAATAIVVVAITGPIIDARVMDDSLALIPWLILIPILLKLSAVIIRIGREWWSGATDPPARD